MIINTNHVRYTRVYDGVLYAYDLAAFAGPYLSKTQRYIQIQRLMMSFWDFFIHVINFSTRAALSLKLSMTGATEPSEFLLTNVASLLNILPSYKLLILSQAVEIWFDSNKIVSIKSVILKYSTKCYLVFWIRNLLSSWISWKKNLLPDEVQHELFNSFFHGFAAIFGPIEPAVANVFECNAVKDD